MKPELLREYAECKIAEKKIKARLEELNPLIKEDIIAAGLDKVPTSMGNFIIKKVKRWTYSPGIADLKEELEKAKSREEADGTATFVDVEQLEFREQKHE